MNRFIRSTLIASGILALLIALGFFLQSPWTARLWPIPASRLSNIFIASILAAVAAPILWIGIVRETRAMAGGALNLGITYAGFAISAFQFSRASQSVPLLIFALVSLVAALVCVGLFIYSSRFRFRDTRPVPIPARLAFGLFSVVLLLAGSALVLRQPNIFPWPLSPETSVLYGWIFLGAMSYFIYALIFPNWGNASGQLLGFLAYDLVLIVPFLAHFNSVPPQLLLSLKIYTSVLVFSGLVALYYLFVHPATRLFTAARKTAVQI
jgi:hypothetical protein